MRLKDNTIIFESKVDLNLLDNHIKSFDQNNIAKYIEKTYSITSKDLNKLLKDCSTIESKMAKADYYEYKDLYKKLNKIKDEIKSVKQKIGTSTLEAFKHNAFINRLLSEYQLDYYQDLSENRFVMVFYPAYGNSLKTTNNKTFYGIVESFYNLLTSYCNSVKI